MRMTCAIALFAIATCLQSFARASTLKNISLPSIAKNVSSSGTMFLYGYYPEMSGAEPSFDLYAFEFNFDTSNTNHTIGIHSQIRLRDDKLRSFYTSNIWFQELYLFKKTGIGEFNFGKIYRKVGLTWDHSFFGNVEYFNGLMLNTNYGAEWLGRQSLGSSLRFKESLQFFPNEANGSTDGALAGRDVNSDANAELRNVVTGRVSSTLHFAATSSTGHSFVFGLSGMNGTLHSLIAQNTNHDLNQLALDATLNWRPISIFAEVLQQNGELDDAQHPYSRPGYDSATYFLGGIFAHIGDRLKAYFNYSSANYAGQNALEQELLPGVVYKAAGNLNVITEFDYWRLMPHNKSATLLDRSYNLVAQYNF